MTKAVNHKGDLEMGRIVVSDNVSLDGVIQDPAGDEGFSRGGWVGLIKDRPELAKLALDEALGAEAMLMGRRTYVVRRPLAIPDWRLGGQVERPAEVRRVVDARGSRLEQLDRAQGRRGRRGLEAEAGVQRGIVVPASAGIVRTLMEHDLVDELRLKVFPVVLGAGERLFGGTSGMKPMRLVDVRTLDGDTTYLTYERVPGAPV